MAIIKKQLFTSMIMLCLKAKGFKGILFEIHTYLPDFSTYIYQ